MENYYCKKEILRERRKITFSSHATYEYTQESYGNLHTNTCASHVKGIEKCVQYYSYVNKVLILLSLASQQKSSLSISWTLRN